VWFEPSELVGAQASKLTTMEATVCLLENGRVVCRGKLPGRGWVLSGGIGKPVVDPKKLGEPWVIPFPGTEVVDVSGGSAHICAVVDGGEIWCSGSNSDGQLGNTGGDSLEPVRVAS
jgi:alpha-tubulin suppressor-like RCC1 family protein